MVKGEPWRFLLRVGWGGGTLLKERTSGLRTEKYDESSLMRSGANSALDAVETTSAKTWRPGRALQLWGMEGRQVSVHWRTGRKGCWERQEPVPIALLSSLTSSIRLFTLRRKEGGKEGKKERKEGWMDKWMNSDHTVNLFFFLIVPVLVKHSSRCHEKWFRGCCH